MIELDKADIYSDLGAYLFARDVVKERGYRICLDAVTDLVLPFIDRERLGFDRVKVFWRPEMADQTRSERAGAFRHSLERLGKTRTILARCDSQDAIKFGQGLGITVFQGRHVDRLLAAAASEGNAPHRAGMASPSAARL